MAAIRIEDAARTDPRFRLLGDRLKTTRFDALARMAELWAYCTEKQTYFLTPKLIDTLAEFENFHEHILSDEIGLAEATDKGIRIRGTKGRIEWLKKLRKNSKKGGERNRANWLSKKKPGAEPNESPSSIAPVPVSSPAIAPVKKQNTPLPPKGLQAIWNQHCGGLPQAETLNRDRERQAKARLTENGDPAYWERIVRAIAANPFCRGDNDRSWVATFDYLLRPKTHVSISEKLNAGVGRQPEDEATRYLKEYEIEKARQQAAFDAEWEAS
jgi:hypothetical protein